MINTQTIPLQKFQALFEQSKQIKSQISQLQKLGKTRERKFNQAMNQYKTYIRKQNELLDKNFRHCEQRNKWYRQEIDISWKNGVANRHLVLRSVARTNVLKKDLDQWLGRIDQNTLKGNNPTESYLEQSNLHAEYMEGSQLMDKYNQILLEYGHKI